MGARIAIVGTGAVGGYVGAHMAQAGEDVTFVDFWPENVETIRARGAVRLGASMSVLGRFC
jgi:2-dehydropantoate 2-reductase